MKYCCGHALLVMFFRKCLLAFVTSPLPLVCKRGCEVSIEHSQKWAILLVCWSRRQKHMMTDSLCAKGKIQLTWTVYLYFSVKMCKGGRPRRDSNANREEGIFSCFLHFCISAFGWGSALLHFLSSNYCSTEGTINA